ncbi:MAG: type II secretion system protein GspG [Patescibacteria group bacterium]|mgnify:CR=1 FL=1
MKRIQSGFTLLELVIVIGVIGVLVGISGLGAFVASQQRSRDARRKADIETFRQALELYRSTNGRYPVYTGSTVSGALYNALTAGAGGPYLNTTSYPRDPQTTKNYYYYSVGVAATYNICALLERPGAGEPACAAPADDCNSVGTTSCNYGQTQP